MNLKIPKIPRIAKTWNASGASMKKPGLGNDPVHLMKKFFMYRNMFGNGFGAMPGDKMPGMGPGNDIGGVQGLASARRMGIL